MTTSLVVGRYHLHKSPGALFAVRNRELGTRTGKHKIPCAEGQISECQLSQSNSATKHYDLCEPYLPSDGTWSILANISPGK